MTYKIESRQKRVAGIGGHNYLALVDEKGVTVLENGKPVILERWVEVATVDGDEAEAIAHAEELAATA